MLEEKLFLPLDTKGQTPASEVGRLRRLSDTPAMQQGVNAAAGWRCRQQGAALCRNNHKVTVGHYESWTTLTGSKLQH